MKSFLVALILLVAGSAYAQEAVDLTVPYTPVPPASQMKVVFVALDWENQRIVIVLKKEDLVVSDAGKSGTLTTRTNATSGSLTMAAGHGLATGDRINVAWTAGTPGKRVNVLVGTVAADGVPISGGNGDPLPAAAAAITTPAYTRTFTTPLEFQYTGIEAVTLLRSLNTANMTTVSFHKRVVTKLIADGKLAGAVSGSPE